MNVIFQQIDAGHRSFHGISLDENECRVHLQTSVKDNLLDREEWHDSLARLRALHEETGFAANPDLLADIQSLLDEQMELKQFRIGEAYAEIMLEQEFVCRFHWNENRDARNPKGNKTGADLVGFTEIDEQVVFLFGEVKTSSETANRPPQVMTYADGIENQLNALHSNRNKRFVLISYLKNKMRHYPDGHPFKIDFSASERSYYSAGPNFQLCGVLVRDVDADIKDLAISYERLKNHILEPNGIKLLALYLPIRKEEWEAIITE